MQVAQVLDYGHITLIRHLASDAFVVEAARITTQTTGNEKTNEELLHHLLKNNHGSPFEFSEFVFEVKAPIFVARQWFRKRIGSYCEKSGRYTKAMEYYTPELSEADTARFTEAANLAYATYHSLIANGVKKQDARGVLPQSMYTEWLWKVNARSLIEFLEARTAKGAQLEIRKYANSLLQLVWPVMPITFDYLVDTGRIQNETF